MERRDIQKLAAQVKERIQKVIVGKDDTVELMLIAVDPAWMGKGINALIFDACHPIYRAHGFKYAETNAELEDNLRIRSIWQEFDTQPNKRRRIYGKNL